MAVLELETVTLVNVRSPEQVLGLADSGASRRGSTYWRRVMACPREHYLASELGWARERRSKALDFGLLWHYCLENYYRTIQQGQEGKVTADEPTTAAFRVLENFASEPGWTEGYETISRMLKSYFEEYDRLDPQRWEIVDIECTLEVPLEVGFGFEYTSRLDLDVIDHGHNDRVLRHIEHKSASALDTNTISGYTQDLQTIGQVWLHDKCVDKDAYPVYLGGIVNVTTKAKEPKNARLPVQPSEGQLESWERSMRFWYRFRDTLPSVDYPQNYGACVRRYGRCDFFDLCGSTPDISPNDLFQITKKAKAGEGTLLPGYRFANRFDIEELG